MSTYFSNLVLNSAEAIHWQWREMCVLSLCHCSDAVPCGSLLAEKRFIIGLTGDRELQEEPHREEEDNDDDDAAFFFFLPKSKSKQRRFKHQKGESAQNYTQKLLIQMICRCDYAEKTHKSKAENSASYGKPTGASTRAGFRSTQMNFWSQWGAGVSV